MKKLFLSLGLIVINCSVLFAEEITITTYYPSPYGSYNDLTANQMKIGSTYSGSGIAFEPNGLLVEGNVGIGTNNPQARLDVQGGTIRGRFSCRSVPGSALGTTSIATCPAGTWLLTGGATCQGPNTHFIHTSYPSANQWVADCYGVAGQPDLNANATAICCDY